MSRGICGICGVAGVGIYRAPLLSKIAKENAITLKRPDFDTAHGKCLRTLERYLLAPKKENTADRDDRL